MIHTPVCGYFTEPHPDYVRRSLSAPAAQGAASGHNLRFSDMIVVGELGGLSLSDNTRGKIMFNRATLDDDRSYKVCPL